MVTGNSHSSACIYRREGDIPPAKHLLQRSIVQATRARREVGDGNTHASVFHVSELHWYPCHNASACVLQILAVRLTLPSRLTRYPELERGRATVAGLIASTPESDTSAKHLLQRRVVQSTRARREVGEGDTYALVCDHHRTPSVLRRHPQVGGKIPVTPPRGARVALLHQPPRLAVRGPFSIRERTATERHRATIARLLAPHADGVTSPKHVLHLKLIQWLHTGRQVGEGNPKAVIGHGVASSNGPASRTPSVCARHMTRDRRTPDGRLDLKVRPQVTFRARLRASHASSHRSRRSAGTECPSTRLGLDLAERHAPREPAARRRREHDRKRRAAPVEGAGRRGAPSSHQDRRRLRVSTRP